MARFTRPPDGMNSGVARNVMMVLEGEKLDLNYLVNPEILATG
jgi:hypothetical protein